MARTHAAIRLDIWGDDDWRTLSIPAQHLYLLLLTSPTLTYAGVADWRPARLAGLSAGATAADVTAAADELEAALFVIRDDETEEILVRSFLKHDGLMEKPNVAKAMVTAYGKTISATLRGVIVYQLRRLASVEPEPKAFQVREVSGLLEKPSIDPAELLGKGSAKGSVKGSQVDPSLLTPNSLLLTPDSTHLTPSTNDVRDDLMGLCLRLQKWIVENGSKEPEIGAGWISAARLMVDKDGRSVESAARLIDWCQQDPFWRANILSMRTFREKYDKLRLAANRDLDERSRQAQPKLTAAQRNMRTVALFRDEEERQRLEIEG
jgi:hypothetical protein